MHIIVRTPGTFYWHRSDTESPGRKFPVARLAELTTTHARPATGGPGIFYGRYARVAAGFLILVARSLKICNRASVDYRRDFIFEPEKEARIICFNSSYLQAQRIFFTLLYPEINSMPQELKDFSSVSPSAKSLLLMKGYTNIPYAKQTAALMQGPEAFDLNFNDKDFWFWIRVMHFESRYWSIDQLLKQTDYKNILELSSGYSLRGLDLCIKDASIHYIDTDLPGIIDIKRDMIAKMQLDQAGRGKFELQPLNALDVSAFNRVLDRFGDGPLTIVNEGLLMYLNLEEKKQLCKTIHLTLQRRGGYWITADVYPKRSAETTASLPQSKSEAAFFEQHNVEENKFESYTAAQAFFKEQGFEIVQEAVPNYQELSVLPNLLKVLPEEIRNSKEPPPKIQATWMLQAV